MRDSSSITTTPNAWSDFENNPPMSPRRVCFTEYVEVNEYEPLNPELKASLYYSREEIHNIRRAIKAAIALRRQRMAVGAKLATELQELVAIEDFLNRYYSGFNSKKIEEVLQEKNDRDVIIPVPRVAKRRRTV
jgi:hypothetical protein